LRHRDDFDDDSSLSSLSTIGDDTEDTTDRFFASFFVGGPDEEEVTVGEWGGYDETDALLDDYDEFDSLPRERTRRMNRFPYVTGDIFKSNYYRQYLCPEKRERTYIESRDRHSGFRSSFRVPLDTVDELTNLFIERGWVLPNRKCRGELQLRTRTELLILCALEHLGNRRLHRQFKIETELSPRIQQEHVDLPFLSWPVTSVGSWYRLSLRWQTL
jgi:hypothetical protein